MAGSDLSSASEVLVDTASNAGARFLFAHGAGAPMDSPFMNAMAAAIARRGVEVVRFEFPYMAARRGQGKRRPPDRADKLLECWGDRIRHYADDSLPLFIGGKSMGGRMATLWAAENQARHCRGLVCFGYPFHPAGRPETLRVDHLAQCRVPLLIIQGERDPLGSRGEVTSYALTASVQLHWLAAANHDLKPLRSSGHSHAEHIDAAANAASAFMRAGFTVAAP